MVSNQAGAEVWEEVNGVGEQGRGGRDTVPTLKELLLRYNLLIIKLGL